MKTGLMLIVSVAVVGMARAGVDPFAPDPGHASSTVAANRAPAAPSAGSADLSEGLDWTCTDPDGDGLRFDVFFGAAGTDLAYVGTVISSMFAWPGVTLRAGEYEWRIEARDEHGLVTVGPTWSFTVLADGTTTATVDASIWASVAADVSGEAAFSDSEPAPGTLSQGPLTGMTFAWIPSGSFEMGSPATEPGRDSDEGPQHRVQIQGFELMTTEVTAEMWIEVMHSTPFDLPMSGVFPVRFVTWNSSIEFISELNQLDTDYYYRLPTEAEWEYACRAGSTSVYFWGDSMEESFCWYQDNAGDGVHRVGLTNPNTWGIYDMSGNVREWCEDCYHEDYVDAPVDGSAWLVPDDRNRVLRGGGWNRSDQDCRSADRNDLNPSNMDNFRINDIGLRLARSAR